jgi:dCTP deaminase
MGIKPDHWIRKMAQEHGMIEPFVDHQVRQGVISFGVSSYGYDIRVADEFKIFTNVYSAIVDPKHFDTQSMVDFKGEVCIIPPNSFALARTIEYFRIPRDVLTICLGKSTYARCGLIVNVTPFEPEWEGYVTLEISNTTPLPSPRSSSSRPMRCARSPMPIKKGNTSTSSRSSSRKYEPNRAEMVILGPRATGNRAERPGIQ